MKLKIFSVHDAKVGAYLNPFFARSTGEAERSFSDAVMKEDTGFHVHAEDYTLFEVGTWDDQTASIDLLPTPHPVCKAIQFLSSNGPESRYVKVA